MGMEQYLWSFCDGFYLSPAVRAPELGAKSLTTRLSSSGVLGTVMLINTSGIWQAIVISLLFTLLALHCDPFAMSSAGTCRRYLRR